MNVLTISDDKEVCATLRLSLTSLAINCADFLTASRATALSAISGKTEPWLVFLEVQHLTEDDLSLLRQLGAIKDLKAIIVGRNLTADTILQAVRNGALDGLGMGDNFESELRILIERLHGAMGSESRLGRLITVLAPHGGAGATVIAANLAAAVATKQARCCLLDLHWRGGDIAQCLNSKPVHTLLSLVGKTEQIDRSMFEQSLVRHTSGIHFLASPEPHGNYRQISSELIQRIVQLARVSYPTVVADLEDCDHEDQVRTLALSDQIVVPFRLDFMALIRTKKLLGHLTPANVGKAKVVLLANRTGQARELTLAQAEELLEAKIKHYVPEDTAVMNEAINLGIPAAIAQPRSKSGRRLRELANELVMNDSAANSVGPNGRPTTLLTSLASFLPIATA